MRFSSAFTLSTSQPGVDSILLCFALAFTLLVLLLALALIVLLLLLFLLWLRDLLEFIDLIHDLLHFRPHLFSCEGRGLVTGSCLLLLLHLSPPSHELLNFVSHLLRLV